jgi:hypothetical protein
MKKMMVSLRATEGSEAIWFSTIEKSDRFARPGGWAGVAIAPPASQRRSRGGARDDKPVGRFSISVYCEKKKADTRGKP